MNLRYLWRDCNKSIFAMNNCIIDGVDASIFFLDLKSVRRFQENKLGVS